MIRYQRLQRISAGYVVLFTLLIAILAVGAAQPSEPPTVRVAGIVLPWIPRDREANYRRAETLVREAAAQGADIVCTTECFLDGYSVRDAELAAQGLDSLAEPIPDGPYFRRMCKLADELDLYVVAALTEKDSAGLYNSAALIDPEGELLGTYRKVFLYGDENNRYLPGDSFPVFDSDLGRIGLMICYDRQKSRAAEELKRNGADMVFCPAGGGFDAWNDSLVARVSLAGGFPVVFVHPNELLVTGPSGAVLCARVFGEEADARSPDVDTGAAPVLDLTLLRRR